MMLGSNQKSERMLRLGKKLRVLIKKDCTVSEKNFFFSDTSHLYWTFYSTFKLRATMNFESFNELKVTSNPDMLIKFSKVIKTINTYLINKNI